MEHLVDNLVGQTIDPQVMRSSHVYGIVLSIPLDANTDCCLENFMYKYIPDHLMGFKTMLLWRVPIGMDMLLHRLEKLVYYFSYIVYSFVMAVYFFLEASR